ncbi:MAG: Coenzyme F420 hydrogenase/dehydrogenase, beta subunit C-terminal domain, partial [Opitutales bacterium]|nr:Coenzyme F420 hydrogenase/dehydrogenase, beta subunit C-terminal domain [Opitutales bacterium]
YLDYTEKRQGFTSKDFVFRDKTVNGWGGYYSRFKVNKLISVLSENWLFIFQSDRYFRESCFNCQYTSSQRIADITISDFWNISRTNKSFRTTNTNKRICANSRPD